MAHLAARAGLEVPSSPENDNTEHYQILYQVLESAAQYYREALRNNTGAIQYLKSRGLSGITAKISASATPPQAGKVCRTL